MFTHVVRGCSLVVLLSGLTFCTQARGANITWIGGNVDWVDASGNTNWNPNDEPDPDDVAIFNTANTVNLGSINTVMGLTLSGGIDLSTSGFDLTIDGTLTASGAGTNFFIDTSTSLVTADTIAINADGTIQIRGGTLTVDEETGTGFLDVNAAGTFSGNGTVNLNDAPGAVTSLLINDGTLSAFRAGTILNPPTADTLTINANAANARINLDGGAEAGVVNVFRNQTLEINGTLQDAFTGDLNMFHDTTLDISSAWSMDGGTFDISNGFIDSPFPSPDVPAGTATVAGGAFTQTGGTILNFASDGTLIFDAAYTQSGGTFTNNGLVTFNGSTLIGSTGNMTMPTNTSSITVGSGAVVNVDQANFDVDGNGTATNVIRINSGGQLDLDLGAGADDTITGTVVLSGGELDVTTSDNTWSLEGSVSTVASSGTSQLNGEALTFVGATVTVATGSTLDINAASTWNAGTDFDIDGVVTVDGAATLNTLAGNPIGGTGTLRFNSTSSINGVNTQIVVSTFDWDGTTAGQVHTFGEDAQLFIDSTTFDSDGDMDDSITMAAGADLIVNNVAQWEMRGTLTTNGTLAKPVGIGGDARMVLTSVTGIWNVNGATFPSDVTFGPSSVTNIAAGALIAGSATSDMIYAGGTITGAGTFSPHLQNTVTDDSSITVTNFNFDNGPWVIDSGATLTVNVNDYDAGGGTNKFDATITLNGGTIDMTVDDAAFVMDGTLNMNTFGQSVWMGEAIEIGNDNTATIAHLNITGIGQTTAPIRFNSDASVNVSSGATLIITNVANFDTVNGVNNASFTGSGTIIFNRQVNFAEATTFNMAGGEIDFDGSDLVSNVINVDAPVTINAATVANFGNANADAFDDRLVINNNSNTGSLTVNLDAPGATWTLNPAGMMNLINDNATSTLLAGSGVNLNGKVNVAGDVRIEAAAHIGGTINLPVNPDRLRLADNKLSTLEGGTIAGGGILRIDGGLTGFGNINNFLVQSAQFVPLRADNGTLTITSGIDVHTLGTADNDGILNIPSPWSTSVARDRVSMSGGQIQGGAITNNTANGIEGFGTIAASVINETKIVAVGGLSGGTLVVETAGNDNDWDGAGNDGRLGARFNGTLEIRDNQTFLFQGRGEVDNTGVLFVKGFELEWEPGSSLNMFAGATYRGTASTDFGGGLILFSSVGANAVIEVAGTFRFESTSSANISETLELRSPVTQIDAGANLFGAGVLFVPAGSNNLRLQDGVDVNILIQNQGQLIIGDGTAAQVTGLDYQQDASGIWKLDLNGLGLNDFDRFNLDLAAQLAGTLDIDLGGGYVPSLGDTFTILSAPAGVTGAFTSVFQPFGMPAGILFDVVYQPTLVQLIVVNAPPGDFDSDGDVDGADFVAWQTNFPKASGATRAQGDADGDGDVDGADFVVWQTNFPFTPGPGAVAVPEPAGFYLLSACSLVMSMNRRLLRSRPARWVTPT